MIMRRKKFCPSCGRETEELIDGLCDGCFSKMFASKLKLPERMEIEVCKDCGRARYRNKLVGLEKVVEAKLRKYLSLPEVKGISYRIRGNELIVTLNLRRASLKKNIQLVFLRTLCKDCSLAYSKYYETKIQLRGKNLELVLKEVEGFLENLRSREKKAFISEVKELKEGKDLYIPSKSVAKKIVNFLKRKYRIKTKISRTLWGLEGGKRIYKDTILVRVDG